MSCSLWTITVYSRNPLVKLRPGCGMRLTALTKWHVCPSELQFKCTVCDGSITRSIRIVCVLPRARGARTDLDAHLVVDAWMNAVRALVSRDIAMTVQLVEEQARRSGARDVPSVASTPSFGASDAAAQVSAWFEDVAAGLGLVHSTLSSFSSVVSGGVTGGPSGALEFFAEDVSIATQVCNCSRTYTHLHTLSPALLGQERCNERRTHTARVSSTFVLGHWTRTPSRGYLDERRCRWPIWR